jgi:uncharacterized protein YecE (DUF72 family)
MHDFYDTITKGLGNKLGSVLFQLHPRIVYSEEKLVQIIEALDNGFENVIEFRHPTWWRPDVLNALKQNSISFCGISYPDLPDDVMKTAATMYYRFHGVPKLYLSSYTDQQLVHVVSQIKKSRKINNVYIYFNNDIEVAAVKNARTVQQLT